MRLVGHEQKKPHWALNNGPIGKEPYLPEAPKQESIFSCLGSPNQSPEIHTQKKNEVIPTVESLSESDVEMDEAEDEKKVLVGMDIDIHPKFELLHTRNMHDIDWNVYAQNAPPATKKWLALLNDRYNLYDQ